MDYGANIDAEDRELWTPLHASAACGNDSMVEYLVERGANVVALNVDGNLPVDLVEEDEDLKNYLFKEMDKHGKVICHVLKVMPLLEDKPCFPLLDYINFIVYRKSSIKPPSQISPPSLISPPFSEEES